MAKKSFTVEVTITAELTVDEAVFKEVLTPGWRAQFYPLASREAVVEHLAYNLLQGHGLNSLDGFAHFRSFEAELEKVEWLDWHVNEGS